MGIFVLLGAFIALLFTRKKPTETVTGNAFQTQLELGPVTVTPLSPVPKDLTMYTDTYNTESWRPIMIAVAPSSGVPIEFAMEWIRRESRGKPCAVGNRFASFDGGKHPRETGIGQLYGPDDYATTKTDPEALRSYCNPKYLASIVDGNGHPVLGKDGKQVQEWAFSQQCARDLTPSEMGEQVRSFMALVKACQHRADHLLSSVGAKWNTSSPDYWKFVKLQHGIPGLANAIAYVTQILTRAPESWNEYATTVMTDPVLALIKEHDAGTYKYYDNPPYVKAPGEFPKTLNNADQTGGVVVGPSVT